MSPPRYPRSPTLLLGGIAHLARLIDKVRLRHAGAIQDYNYLTTGFDKYLLELLQIPPELFEQRVLAGGTDEELLAWVRDHAPSLSEDDLSRWNDRIRTGGPKDDAARERFARRLAEVAQKHGVPIDALPRITTWADLIELDEGRL